MSRPEESVSSFLRKDMRLYHEGERAESETCNHPVEHEDFTVGYQDDGEILEDPVGIHQLHLQD